MGQGGAAEGSSPSEGRGKGVSQRDGATHQREYGTHGGTQSTDLNTVSLKLYTLRVGQGGAAEGSSPSEARGDRFSHQDGPTNHGPRGGNSVNRRQRRKCRVTFTQTKIFGVFCF